MNLRWVVLSVAGLCVGACSCGRRGSGVEVRLRFEGFTPGCVEVEVVDLEEPSRTGLKQVAVTVARDHRIAIGRSAGWSDRWTITAKARERSCTGAVVAVQQAELTVPAGRVHELTLTLSAVDRDGDGFVAGGGGTDCDDNRADRSPGEPERCDDALDNDCDELRDCADMQCGASSCDDRDFCTVADACQADGGCLGFPRRCGPAASPCHLDAGVCDSAAARCAWPSLPLGASCGPSQVCTSTGACVDAGTELDCSDGADDDGDSQPDCFDSDCLQRTCDAGPCVPSGSCTSLGACTGAPLPCNAPGVCRTAGYCDAGACSYPLAASMTPCDDGVACTNPDRCDAAGRCVGAPVVCTPSGGCQAAFCDAGTCEVRTLTGACDDGMACTSGDSCATGSCVGTPFACTSPPQCRSMLNACDGDGGCNYPPDPTQNGMACGDGGACFAGSCEGQAFAYVPSNLSVAPPNAGQAVLVNCVVTLNSADGGASPPTWCGAGVPSVSTITQAMSGEPALLVQMRGLEVTGDGGQLRLLGTRPVIMLVHDRGVTDIRGLVNARAVLDVPGAGGNRSSCGGQTPGDANNNNDNGAGGGGAGWVTRGGAGGPGDFTMVNGQVGGMLGPADLMPLVGGCRGGRGGFGNLTGSRGEGGAGGGAFQLSAAGVLRVYPSAVLTASGGGAPGVLTSGRGGGGGGGTGGGILLEGDGLELLAGAWVTANGGAGAEGADIDEPGARGGDGRAASTQPANGGTGTANIGGPGGNGGTVDAGPTAGGGLVSDRTGGGGGGSVGRIHLRQVGMGACTRAASFSPLPSNQNCP